MQRYRRGLLTGLLLAAMAPTAMGATVITFEELTTNGPGQGGQTAVTNQYASLGVTFNFPSALDYSKGLAIPNFAHSGTKAVEQCYAAEFCTAPIAADFTAGQARVKVWVGYSFRLQQAATVILRGLNSGGTVVTSTTVTLPAKTDGPTPIRFPLEIGRFAADIRRIEVDFLDNNTATNSLAMDDLEFDTIGPPPPCEATTPPGLTLVSPTNGTTTRCNRFLFQDTVVNTDPFARRTVTVRGSTMGQINTWTSQVTSGTGGPTWVYDMLFPGVNNVTDRVENCRGATERTVTITYDPIPDGTRVVVMGFEPTQSVQTLPNSVPLITDKRTIVRVYVRLEGPLASLPGIRGRLNAYQPSANPLYELGPPIAPLNVQSLNSITVTPSTDLAAAREDLGASLNFEIPASWTAPGEVHFELSALTLEGCDIRIPLDGGDNRHPFGNFAYNRFSTAPPVRVRIVDVPYQTTAGGTVHTPRDKDRDQLLSWLQRAYPTAQVLSSRLTLATRTGTPDSSFDADDINSKLQDVRSMETSNGSVDNRTKYYGLVHDGGGFMRGKADGIPSWVASGPTGPGTFGWDTDGSYGDWYGGHELGHTYGRFHAKFCGADECFEFIWTFCPDGYVPYPYPGGLLHGNFTSGNYGLDLGDPGLGLPMKLYPPNVAHDVMTYCDDQWLSDFTYNGILRRLKDENPNGDFAVRKEKIADALLLSAKMNLTQETAQLRPFWRLPNLDATERPAVSHYSIQLRDATGNTLAVYLFTPKVDTEAVEGEDLTASLSEVVPWVAGTRRIVILRDDIELASRTVTQNTPVVQVLSPNGGENLDGETAEVTWQGSDADVQPLTYALHYSRDAGQTWQVVDTGIQGTAYTVDLDLIPGSASALFRVLATDGVNTGSDTSDATFTVRTKLPDVRIIAPANNAAFTSADTVVFTGEASDLEDGFLSGSSLQWTSDIQGTLGAGTSVATSLLPGTHTVMLAAMDSGGETATATVTVVVSAAPPVADPGRDRNVVVGAPVSLDGTGSTGAPSLSYRWEIAERPDGSTATLSNADTATPVFTPDRFGRYVLQLTLTDGTGTEAVAQVVIIATSAANALRIAGGLAPSSPADVTAMNIVTGGPSETVIDIADAVNFARQALLSSSGGGVVTVTVANQYGGIAVGRGYGVYLDDPRLNNRPDQRVLAVHQFVGHYNAPMGVWYDSSARKWVAYNEDRSVLEVGEKVNYAFGPDFGAVTRNSAGGPFPWGVTLDDPRLNFNPDATVLATHNFVGAYGEPLGVRYNGSRWIAYHETGGTIPGPERYFWADAGASGGRVTRSASTAYSTYGVYINDARINGNSGAIVLAQHAGQASYNSSPVGVWFDGLRWVAYNEDRTPLGTGEVIHYMIVQP